MTEFQTVRICGDQIEQCVCREVSNPHHEGLHRCECGSKWAVDGTPVLVPPEDHEHAWRSGVVGQRT